MKNWFRAYLNLGLIAKTLGHDRLIPCTAASDFVFIDPWSDVYACNVRPDLLMGNLGKQAWSEISRGQWPPDPRKVGACHAELLDGDHRENGDAESSHTGSAETCAAWLGAGQQVSRDARASDSVR